MTTKNYNVPRDLIKDILEETAINLVIANGSGDIEKYNQYLDDCTNDIEHMFNKKKGETKRLSTTKKTGFSILVALFSNLVLVLTNSIILAGFSVIVMVISIFYSEKNSKVVSR